MAHQKTGFIPIVPKVSREKKCIPQHGPPKKRLNSNYTQEEQDEEMYFAAWPTGKQASSQLFPRWAGRRNVFSAAWATGKQASLKLYPTWAVRRNVFSAAWPTRKQASIQLYPRLAGRRNVFRSMAHRKTSLRVSPPFRTCEWALLALVHTSIVPIITRGRKRGWGTKHLSELL